MPFANRRPGVADILYVMATELEYGPELRSRITPLITGVGPFILFVIVRTAGDGMFHPDAPVWHAAVNAGQSASELFLVCGMTAVGLSVSFNDMWRIGWRPLAAGLLVATLVGLCSLTLTSGMYRFFG